MIKEVKLKSEKDMRALVDRSTQNKQQTKDSFPRGHKSGRKSVEIFFNCQTQSAPLCAPLPRPSRPTPISGIILIFFGIIFGILFGVFKYVVEYNLCKILNENENEFELEFKTVENENVNCDFYDYDLCNGYYPTPYPTSPPRPTIFNFTNSRAGLREQLVLEDIFGIVYGGEYDCNNVCEYGFNENFCNNNGYCYPPLTPAPTPQIIIVVNDTGIGILGIDTGLCGNDILDSIFGINNNENDIVNEIFNEINNGMIFFFSRIFFFVVLF